jgi:protein-tyrosine-phosphatase
MAQAFFEQLAPADVRAESAGTEPGQRIWPEVVRAMAEVGIDIAQRKPKKLTREMQLRAEAAVTMGCGDACPFVPTRVVEWNVPDPAKQPPEAVRAIRDTVEQHVRGLSRRRPSAERG